jgi:hypothetical protein
MGGWRSAKKPVGIGVSTLLVAGGIAVAVPYPPLVTAGVFIPGEGNFKIDDCYGCATRPGTYESAGAADGLCLWTREVKGPQAHEIARGHAKPDQAVRVTLNRGEYFTTLWCEPWKQVTASGWAPEMSQRSYSGEQ